MGKGSTGGSAERLVEDVLDACGRSRTEAARLLWEHGASRLRSSAGDEAHLERLLGNELFSPLVDARRFELGPLERIDDAARQQVTLFLADGQAARFLFSLRLTGEGDGAGRWTITGLEREW